AATHQLSSPLQRFTPEFGIESEWFHRAIGTRKTLREFKIQNSKFKINNLLVETMTFEFSKP
ncbi:hypothetical protein, partial [Brasilonema sp. UFV-L1]|uniref:hypothetical protein n=1 Tax=Brasilonema sp. UFV-L1 TaxID=2234130 RepID=UPI0016AE43FE